MRKRKATVLMPVYNSAPYLQGAVSSILHQSFSDFEFLIFDDGSTDGSRQILESFDDPRIRLFCHPENTNYAHHLNKGIELARGEYLFRMDSDDIAFPHRLERQVAFLDAHPEVGLCGSWAQTSHEQPRLLKRPETHEEIRLQLLNGTTFIHPTVALRTAMLRRHGLRYREDLLYAEDYGLWLECAKVTRMAILPEVLLQYRIHDNSVSSLHRQRQMDIVNTLRTELLEELLGRPLSGIEQQWATYSLNISQLLPLRKLSAMFQDIEQANRHRGSHPPELLRDYLFRRTAYLFNRQALESRWMFFLNLMLLSASFPAIGRRLGQRTALLFHKRILKLLTQQKREVVPAVSFAIKPCKRIPEPKESFEEAIA